MPRPEPPSMGWSELIHRLAAILRYKWWDLKQWVRPERHQYISEMEEPEAPVYIERGKMAELEAQRPLFFIRAGLTKTVVIVLLLAGIGYYELRLNPPGVAGHPISRRKTYNASEVITAEDYNRRRG